METYHLWQRDGYYINEISHSHKDKSYIFILFHVKEYWPERIVIAKDRERCLVRRGYILDSASALSASMDVLYCTLLMAISMSSLTYQHEEV